MIGNADNDYDSGTMIIKTDINDDVYDSGTMVVKKDVLN